MATEVEVIPDSFIPVSVGMLNEGLCQLLRDLPLPPDALAEPEEEWRQFVDNLRAVVALFYDSMVNEIRKAVDEIDDLGSAASLIANLMTLFEASQYTRLTASRYELAQAGDFEFDFPTEVEWRKLDDTFIGSFGADLGKAGEEWEQMQRHMLVFTRGTSETTKTGLFIPQKIDYILESLQRVFLRRGPEATTEAAEALQQRVENSTCSFVKKVARNTLKDAIREHGFFRSLFMKITITEPTFDKVCVVYKRKTNITSVRTAGNVMKSVLKLKQGLLRRKSSGQMQTRRGSVPKVPTTTVPQPAVGIELYEKIPYADLEAVFPSKRIKLKKLDSVVFFVKIVVSAVVLALTIRNIFAQPEGGQQRVKGTMLLVGLLLAAISKQGVALVMQWMDLQKRYERDVHRWVQEHTLAVGLPVVAQLVDDVKEQEIKEMMLAYFFLWHPTLVARARNLEADRFPVCIPTKLSTEEVDAEVEHFIKDVFSLEADFDADDGLEKLNLLGLVTVDDDKYSVNISPKDWVASHPHQPLTSLKFRTRITPPTGVLIDPPPEKEENAVDAD
eukprot:Sspe_Gene.34810::Locus_16903_Transcript_1_1_Confidence_1.000_Length_1772::g.34810::m.34810